jgi:peptidoglycan/xylan/chitin deacetylase (PgdA/CDA1 family)
MTCSELERIIKFFDDLKVTCTFFVVPDDSLVHASEDFKSRLRHAVNSGHEIALHGYMHKKNEFGIFYPLPLPIPIPSLRKQKELIKKGMERMLASIYLKPEGFRAPYYLHNSNTSKALAELGMKYDSSATVFKTTHCSSFRIKWLNRYGPFMADGVVEIPVSGDYTFNLENYGFTPSLKVALRDFDLMNISNGVFVINNHPICFHNEGIRFLEVLIQKIGERTDFEKLGDVARTFENRNQLVQTS